MVNKQGQKSMRTAIKVFQEFGWMRLEVQNLGPFLVIKYTKDYSHQNMLIIKVVLLFFLLFNEKKGLKDCADF